MQVEARIVFAFAGERRDLHHHSILGLLKFGGVFVAVHYDVVACGIAVLPENVFRFAFVEPVVPVVRDVTDSIDIVHGYLIQTDLDVHFGQGQPALDQVVDHQSGRTLDIFGVGLADPVVVSRFSIEGNVLSAFPQSVQPFLEYFGNFQPEVDTMEIHGFLHSGMHSSGYEGFSQVS